MNATLWLIVFVTLYWGYCLYWGIRGSRLSHTAEDYFIANRSLPLLVFILAATATSFSAWTFVGHSGGVYSDGFQYVYASFYAITIPFTGMLFLKRQWLLGQRFGYVTPGEMFADYFNSPIIMRLLVILIALCFSVPYLGLQLQASGILSEVITRHTDYPISEEFGMWLLASVLITYVVMGGLRAIAYVDNMQAVLLAVGLIVLGTIVLFYVGGWEQLNEGIAALAQVDLVDSAKPSLTPDGNSHYLAISGMVQPVWSAKEAVGGQWTGIMILTFMLALMGIQSSPAFSMWAFSSQNANAFAPQQVWASSLIIGFILIIFTPIIGMGAHFLGSDAAMNQAYPEYITSIMVPNDLENPRNLVPLLIKLTTDISPWLPGLLAICALAAIQSTGASYMFTAGGLISRDFIKPLAMPKASDTTQILFGRLSIVIVALLALIFVTSYKDGLVLTGGLAVAYGLQMWPALVAICWWPFLTRQGIIVGLIAGMIVVTLTDKIGQDFFNLPWGRFPLTVHSAGWGILFNFTLAILVSLLTQNKEETQHRQKFHQVFKNHASLSENKRGWILPAWFMVIGWFLFAVGPLAVFGNTFFGDPKDPISWLFGIPSIWAWQIIWWALGVGMMWFLAYKMEMSTAPTPSKSDSLASFEK